MFLLKSVNRLVGYPRSVANVRLCSDILQKNAKAGAILDSVLEKWKNRFEQEKIPEVDSSLKNIFAHVLALDNLEKVGQLQNVEVTEEQLNKIEELCECRLLRMPVQYILGEWDFRDITLKMMPPVFIPRPETEELVELILQQVDPEEPVRILEIGSGTGAISLSLLHSLPKVRWSSCTI
jgi:release factor glutamine methyltransferase